MQKKEAENNLLKKYKIYESSAHCYVAPDKRINSSFDLVSYLQLLLFLCPTIHLRLQSIL